MSTISGKGGLQPWDWCRNWLIGAVKLKWGIFICIPDPKGDPSHETDLAVLVFMQAISVQ